MSSDPVVIARGLGKHYATGRQPLQRLWNALRPRPQLAEPGQWALRDASFELGRGETLGIMGRNGCGKSTLLEIVSGTLRPTAGTVEVRGELAALLELGAAFAPELTGRENVFVYGSVLGLSNQALRARFDEIVAFAELESSIDAPLRSYSSGMVMRLAFATAIHAAPEILVIDEALAVGDEAFQRRCFARIEALKAQGVSLLFVSHAAGVVSELCDRVLLLDRGEVLRIGTPREVIDHYHRLIYAAPEEQEAIRAAIREGRTVSTSTRTAPESAGDVAPVTALEDARFDPELRSKSRLEYASRGARILEPEIVDESGRSVNVLSRGGRYSIAFRIVFERDAFQVRPGMLVKNVVGTELGGIVASPRGDGQTHVPAGSEWRVRIPFRARLASGTYFANVGVVGASEGEEVFLHRITDALAFRVLREAAGVVTGSVDLSTPEPVQVETEEASPRASERPS